MHHGLTPGGAPPGKRPRGRLTIFARHCAAAQPVGHCHTRGGAEQAALGELQGSTTGEQASRGLHCAHGLLGKAPGNERQGGSAGLAGSAGMQHGSMGRGLGAAAAAVSSQ